MSLPQAAQTIRRLRIAGFPFCHPFLSPRNGVFAVEHGKTPFRGDKEGGQKRKSGKANNAAPEALEIGITRRSRAIAPGGLLRSFLRQKRPQNTIQALRAGCPTPPPGYHQNSIRPRSGIAPRNARLPARRRWKVAAFSCRFIGSNWRESVTRVPNGFVLFEPF